MTRRLRPVGESLRIVTPKATRGRVGWGKVCGSRPGARESGQAVGPGTHAACPSSLRAAESDRRTASALMCPSSLTSSNRTETCLETPDSCMVTP